MLKESKKLLIKSSREENLWGGENIFEEGVTRGRVARAEIHQMSQPVEVGLTGKDKGNLLLAEFSERWRVTGVGHCTAPHCKEKILVSLERQKEGATETKTQSERTCRALRRRHAV